LYSLYSGDKQQIKGKVEEVKENNESINWVNCMYQTDDGVIWMGTMNGLITYYGTNFKHYRFEPNNKESLPSNSILNIWEETPGILWISTTKGLAKLNRLSGKIIRFPAASRFICKGNNGKLYTTAKDLCQIDTVNKKLIHVPGQEIYLENGQQYKDERLRSIFNFAFNKEGTLWATGASKTLSGLFQFNFKTNHWTFHAQPTYYDTIKKENVSLIYFNEPRSDSNNLTNQHLYIGKDGRIWLTGWEGLACYNPKENKWQQFRVFADPDTRYSDIVDEIVPMNDSLFILSGGNIVFNTNTHAYKRGSVDTLPNLSYGGALLKDNQNNIWFTDVRSLKKLNIANNYFQEVAHLPYVTAFLSLDSNSFFIKHGRWIFKIMNYHKVDSLQTPSSAFANPQIINAGNDKFYLISDHVYAIDWRTKAVQQIQLKVINSTLPEPTTFTSNVLWNDSIIYSTRTAINQPDFMKINLKQHALQYFTTPAKAQSSGNIYFNANSNLFSDSYKRIWITSYHAGIDVFYPKTETFGHYDHLAGDSISLDNNLAPVMVETKDHRFFIASVNGLIEVKAKPGTPFTFETVAPEVCFTQTVEEDTTGMLWVGHNNGILRYNPATHEYKIFTAADGFRWALTPWYFFKLPDGNFLMDDGTVINPYNAQHNALQPTPRVVDFMIAGQPTHFDTAIEFKKHIQLQHDQNFFNITYSCNNYVNEEKNEYRYFLQGVDKNWTNAGTRTTAFYTALPPGDYYFYVQAANNDGVWGDKKLMLSISIIPAWYQTGLFKILLTIAIIAIIYIIYRQRINTIRAKSLAEQRAAELKQVKAEFEKQIAETEMAALRAQMNPHFIFNVLNSINRFILSNDSTIASDYLSQFSRLIRLILENSKSAKVPLEKDLEALRIYIDMEKLRFQNRFSYEISVDENIDQNYVQVPPLLIQPYVENAIWHGLMQKETPGHLCVSIALIREDLIKVVIEDDGIGREKSAQLKSKTATTHKSFGLQISKDRIRIVNKLYGVNTQVEVEDLKDEHHDAAGTRIHLFIPV